MLKSIAERIKKAKAIGKQLNRPWLATLLDVASCRLRYGAILDDYMAFEFYRKNAAERDTFVTEKRLLGNLIPKANPDNVTNTFDDKAKFNHTFANFIKRDWIATEDCDEDKIRSFLMKYPIVFVKETEGSQGLGVKRMETSDPMKIEEILQWVRKGQKFVIEEPIRQHPDMAYFNESSVNSIRMETMIDDAGKVRFFNTIVIIGGKGSIVSNTHTGGVMCHINEELGVIDSPGRNPKGERFIVHPQNGNLLMGKMIPMWKEVMDYSVNLAKVCPEARFIGWDIAITENGPEVIEGNTKPGMCTQACDMVGRWPLVKSLITLK